MNSSSTAKKSNMKGKSGEREFVRRVYRLTDGQIELRRNLSQSRDGGDDLGGFGNLSIEVKRWKRITDAMVRDWWTQCHHNAVRVGKIPVLAFRADQQEWKVLMHPNTYFNQSEVVGCLMIHIELFAKYLVDPDNKLPLAYH